MERNTARSPGGSQPGHPEPAMPEHKDAGSLPSPFRYGRLPTREVMVGHVGVGKDNPIRIQSMTSSPTLDTAATVAEILSLHEAGCEIARVTAKDQKEAENLAAISRELRASGCPIPLVADIHYSPRAAMIAVEHVEKVRINPGNFVERSSGTSEGEEGEHLRQALHPLLFRAKELGRAIRIGVNHGSLSPRMMDLHGDTPEGMVESAIEFLKAGEEIGFRDFIVSMKASNPQVMIRAYRLLVLRFAAEKMDYPLHLGVTEAGDGRDGRIKSAVGIGSLLEDGIGDTIRVSLTEDSVQEIPVARSLTQRYDLRTPVAPWPQELKEEMETLERRYHQLQKYPEELPRNSDPFPFRKREGENDAPPAPRSLLALPLRSFPEGSEEEQRKEIRELIRGGCNLILLRKAHRNPAALRTLLSPPLREEFLKEETDQRSGFVAELDLAPGSPLLEKEGSRNLSRWFEELTEGSDGISLRLDPSLPDAEETLAPLLPLLKNSGLPLLYNLLYDGSVRNLPALLRLLKYLQKNAPAALFALEMNGEDTPEQGAEISPTRAYRILRTLLHRHEPLPENEGTPSLLLRTDANDEEESLYTASIHSGGLLLDGIGAGILPCSREGSPFGGLTLALDLLQAVRLRINRADFISCPSCGRTLFDIQKATARIKSKTSHLKGVKIGIMGCIVNGPGEMADADFGYVGAGPGKIHLYRGREVVKKNLPEDVAAEELVQLIKDSGFWQDPSK